jgi:GNAT superfamily N-acetyltransferase
MDPTPTEASVQVRVAVPEDLDAVVGLHHRHERPDEPPPDGPTDRQLAAWEQMMATAGLTVYVAVMEVGRDGADGHVVGNTCMTVVPGLINDCRPTAFVEPMLVAAPRRRLGIGRMMVERLLADARALGVHKVQLLSHKRHADDGAHAFYRSLGFVAEAEGFRLYPSGRAQRAG